MSNILKVIACISMLIDHIGKVFYPDAIIFHIIGRIALPLFCYMIAQGIKNTKNQNRYILIITLLAIISQAPYMLCFNRLSLNILFGFIIAIALISDLYKISLSKIKTEYMKVIIIGLSMIITEIAKIEYGFYIIALVLIFRYLEDRKTILALMFIATAIIAIKHMDIFQFISMLSILMIKLYDYRIKLNKYVFYAFYPVHLMMLFMIGHI